MKYADIVKIFDEAYFESNDDEMGCLGEWLNALCEGKDKTADFYRKRADAYYYEGKGMMEFFKRLEDFAKRSGEDVNK